MSTNEYGLDTSYMSGKLKIFLRDIDRHTPDEAARVLARLAKVADEKVLHEPEFSERDTYRELCGELINTLRITESWFEGWASAESELAQIRLAITKTEAILGENNAT